MNDLDLEGFERYCKNVHFIKSINAYKGYLKKGVQILNVISSISLEEYVVNKEKNSNYLKNEFTKQIEIEKLHNDLYIDFSSAAKKYIQFKNESYPLSREKIAEKYDNLFNEIREKGAMKLKTQNGSLFNLEVNSTSLCARGVDGKGQECQSIAKDKIIRILFKNENYTYESYEPVVINYLFGLYKNTEYIKIVEHGDVDNLDKSEQEEKTLIPLNQILYGPPGTGKTYNTINKAIEIIDNNFYQMHKEPTTENRTALKNKFDELKESGQIVFTTFHQSYGYEEFVEGIKAKVETDKETNHKTIIYDIEDGVFKNLCDQAKTIKLDQTSEYIFEDKVKIWKISLGDSQNSEDDYIYDYCIENNKILLGFGEGINFYDCNNRKEIAIKLDDSKKYSYPPTAIDTLKNKMKIDDIVLVSFGNRKLRAIAKIIGEYEFLEDEELGNYVQSRAVEWLLIPEEPFTFEKVLKKQFSQMSIYDIKNNTKIESLKELLSTKMNSEVSIEKNYVLIIDEINRGNISKIFGELITLIEDSKRINATEEIRVSLPYSGMGDDNKGFGVPSNLYIIGTMNTADRSIALMDTALRRRFEFVEMMPDLETLNDLTVDSINIKSLLETINKRIEYLYDRDHTIGHAYFMSLKDPNITDKKAELDNIFRNKIIPLLQEYFYDDWEKILMVLGSEFINKQSAKSDIFDEEFTKDSEYIEDDKFIYSVKKSFEFTKFQK